MSIAEETKTNQTLEKDFLAWMETYKQECEKSVGEWRKEAYKLFASLLGEQPDLLITIEFEGSGDSGEVADVLVENGKVSKEVLDEVEQLAFELFDNEFPGWEISDGEVDGGNGSVEFSPTGISMQFDRRVIQTEVETSHCTWEEVA